MPSLIQSIFRKFTDNQTSPQIFHLKIGPMDIFEGITESAAIKLVELIKYTTYKAIVSLLIANGLFCFFMYDDISLERIVVWVVATTSLVGLRLWRVTRLIADDNIHYRTKLLIVTGYTLCTGAAYASVVCFFPYLNSFDRALLTAMLIIICGGSVMTNLGYRPFYMCFSVPVLLSLTLHWAINPGSTVTDATSLSIGFMMILVLVTLWFLGYDTFRAFANSVRANDQQIILAAELKQALKSAELAREQAEISSESKSRFLSAASHDLRQPVHVLTLYGAALKRENLDERSREAVVDMNSAIESLASQIDSLLDLSRLDSGDIKPKKQPIALNKLLSGLEPDFHELARSKNIQFINTVTESFTIYSDPVMLSQILRNLCGNAIKYTDNGEVRVSLKLTNGARPVLEVTDTGVGIPKENHQEVFEEFFQLHNPERDTKRGLGLGLSIVERLVAILELDITIWSTYGTGTTVAITLETIANADSHRNPSKNSIASDTNAESRKTALSS